MFRQRIMFYYSEKTETSQRKENQVVIILKQFKTNSVRKDVCAKEDRVVSKSLEDFQVFGEKRYET